MEYYNICNTDYLWLAKASERFVETKIEILSYHEYVMYEISDDIIEGSDKYTLTYNQGVQGKLSFSVSDVEHLYGCDCNSPFWYGNKLRYWKGISSNGSKNKDDKDTYWFCMGTFVVTNISDDDDILNVSCIDKFGLITSEGGRSCFKTSAKIEAGVSFVGVVRDLLGTDAGNGYCIDPTTPVVDIRLWDEKIGRDIEIGSGGYLGDALIESATTKKCRIYYDRFGRMRVAVGSDDYAHINQAPAWILDDKKSSEYLSAKANYNYNDIINRVTVWGENFEGVYHSYTAENTNPKSPTNISKVGYFVGKTVESMYGYEQENVEAFAKYYLQIKTIQGLAVPVECAILPHLWVGDVVLLSDQRLEFEDKRLIIEEINIDGNTMSLSLTNVDSLPYYTEISG